MSRQPNLDDGGLAHAPIWRTARRYRLNEQDLRHALRNWVHVKDSQDDVTLFSGPTEPGT